MTLALSLAAAIALLTGLAAFRSRRELRRWLGRDPAGLRRLLRATALTAAGGLLAAAWLHAAQRPPGFSGAEIDLVLALDTSSSMDVTDTAPSRLRRALRTADELVASAPGARLGLVLFAGDAYVALPLTLDHEVHRTYLMAVDSGVLSRRGSNLARALHLAASVFDPRSTRPRYLVLLSDGEHSGGSLDDALVELRGQGIPVVAVGFGRPEGDVVPGPRGPLFDRHGNAVVSRRSDAVLERIAQATGGRYVRDLEDGPTGADLLPPAGERAAAGHEPGRGLLFALALAVFTLLALEMLASTAPRTEPRGRVAVPHWLRAPASALLALALLGIGPATWLADGDEELRAGAAQEALSFYRRNARAYGPSVASQIRIGNALYRLEEHDRAAASYLDALRGVTLEDRDARFVASFNLGNALLVQERYAEAREHFWTALLERPDSLEAKFNYEWATEHMRELEPPPAPDVPTPPSPPGEGEGEATDSEDGGTGGPPGSAQARSGVREHGAPDLQETEARRWLETIEDQVGDPLRRQATQSLGAESRSPIRGQTW